MGLDCVLVQDATAAATEMLREATIASICEEGGIFGAVTDTESVLGAFGKA